MVDLAVNTNIFSVADLIVIPLARNANEEWFAEDITVLTSGMNRGATIVVDFSFSVPTIVEYTLDGGTTFIEFNQGIALMGGQSRYIRVTSGVRVNFRATEAGVLNRAIVGEV